MRKDHFCHRTAYMGRGLPWRSFACTVLQRAWGTQKCSDVTARGTSNVKAAIIESFYVQKYYITINNFKHKY